MLSEAQAKEAAALIWQYWHEEGMLVTLPEELRPASRADGYAIQAGLERGSRHPVFGWKIAATSRSGQQHIGVDGPLAGRLFAERAVQSGAAVSLSGNRMRVAEPEFAFRMAASLPPRPTPYGVAEVLAAVGTLHPAIEIPDSRFAEFASVGAAQLIADDACARDFVLGPACRADWRAVDLAAHPVVCRIDGQEERAGSGANVLGDPRLALTWLANELSGLGVTLAAGQVVTTGTCMPPLPIAPGDRVTADFGPLGQVEVTLS